MPRRITIAGFGPVGRTLAPLLAARGDAIRIVQRSEPREKLSTFEFAKADLTDARQASDACAAVDVVVCAIGLPYRWRAWTRTWTTVMRNLLDGCARSGARFVLQTTFICTGRSADR